jgi:hypothetical protein
MTRMPFGKFRGMPIVVLPPDYLHWLTTNELKEPLKTAVRDEAARRGFIAPVVRGVSQEWAERIIADGVRVLAKKNHPNVGGEVTRRDVGQVDDWDEALKMTKGRDSFIASLVLTTLTNGGSRPVIEKDPAVLCRAVMKNPFLRHFYYAILYYMPVTTRPPSRERLAARRRAPSSGRSNRPCDVVDAASRPSKCGSRSRSGCIRMARTSERVLAVTS